MRSDIEQSYETSALANLSKAFQATWESCTRGIPHVTQTPRTTIGSRLVVNFSH
jgi:hypothetical protein